MTPANDTVGAAEAAVISYAWAVATRHPCETARCWAALFLSQLIASGAVALVIAVAAKEAA